MYEAAPPSAGEDPPSPNRDPHPCLGSEDPCFGSFPFAARRNPGSLESLIPAPPLPHLLLHSAHHEDSISIMTLGNWNVHRHKSISSGYQTNCHKNCKLYIYSVTCSSLFFRSPSGNSNAADIGSDSDTSLGFGSMAELLPRAQASQARPQSEK